MSATDKGKYRFFLHKIQKMKLTNFMDFIIAVKLNPDEIITDIINYGFSTIGDVTVDIIEDDFYNLTVEELINFSYAKHEIPKLFINRVYSSYKRKKLRSEREFKKLIEKCIKEDKIKQNSILDKFSIENKKKDPKKEELRNLLTSLVKVVR